MATKTKTATREVIDQRLVKALAHPMRVQVLTILNEKVASPNQIAKELGEGLSQVSYHVKVLKGYDCIELVKTEPRRGAVEHFYRATARAFITAADWQRLPESVRPGISATLLQTVMDDAVLALQGGTFDAREDSHLSWTPLIVDEQGWQDLAAVLSETLDRVLEIQAESAGRLAEARQEGFAATVSMMGYEASEKKKIRAPREP